MNAVIYARYSSDKQREESITAQLRECRSYALKNGYTVINEYVDRAFSARTSKRPDFLRMIRDSAAHTFQFVIVYQLDRFSRSRFDSAIYKGKLKKNGVHVISAKEYLPEGPERIWLESTLEAAAEYYSADLSRKVLRGMEQNVIEHKWPGGTVPFGYMLDTERHLVVNEDQAAAVRFIFHSFIAGKRISEIADMLNEKGYRTSRNRLFSRNSFSCILHNKIYVGTFTYRNTEYEGFTTPIIKKDTFLRAQVRCDSRKNSRSIASVSPLYALTGKLYCGICGNAMVGISGTSRLKRKYCYYVCSGNTHKREKLHGKKCRCKNIRSEFIEDAVLKATVSMLNTPANRQFIVNSYIAFSKEDAKKNDTIQLLKSRINEINKKLDNTVKAIEAGVLTDTIAKNVKKYDDELKVLRAQLAKEHLLSNPLNISADFIEYFLVSMLHKMQNGERKLDIFKTFIRRIIVYPDFVAIQYNYQDSLQGISNPIRLEGSYLQSVVDHQGFEPWTP